MQLGVINLLSVLKKYIHTRSQWGLCSGADEKKKLQQKRGRETYKMLGADTDNEKNHAQISHAQIYQDQPLCKG